MRRFFQLEIANSILFEHAIRDAETAALREMLSLADARQIPLLEAEIRRRERGDALGLAATTFLALALFSLLS